MSEHLILAIETSCDETAAAVFKSGSGVLSSVLFSQIELHRAFGGVVPEIASRSHLEKIGPIVQEALTTAGVSLDDITDIAITTKPGLPGSLLVGLAFGKALAFAAHKRLVGVDHLEGHIFSSCLENKVPFPHLCLAASGGHTSLYCVHDFGAYKTVGHTLDDAAGEAFDKVAKLMDLGYPGGPIIEKLAHEVGNKDFFNYPRGSKSSCNMSFSGLKTAVLYDLVEKGAYNMNSKTFLKPADAVLKQHVASSLLVCIADIFKQKLALALELFPQTQAITFVGGVACNQFIRNQLAAWSTKNKRAFFSPSPKYCGDNAAMIALVAQYKAQQGQYASLDLDIL